MSFSATASSFLPAPPARVLDLILEPAACRSWSPVGFELPSAAAERLCTGSQIDVTGELAGRRATFAVTVHRADERCVSLEARGAISLDVRYTLEPCNAGTELRADILVGDPRGITGRLAAVAVQALLGGGALKLALSRISASLQPTGATAPQRALIGV